MQEHNKKRGQLSQGERIEIYALRKQEVSLRGIGRILKRSHSTISKELDRNSTYLGWDRYRYDPLEANEKAKERRVKANQKNTKLLKNPKMLKLFEERFIAEADSQGIDEIIGIINKVVLFDWKLTFNKLSHFLEEIPGKRKIRTLSNKHLNTI